MNFMEKVNNNSTIVPPNLHDHQYYYTGGEGSSRSAPTELDLMDASPLHSHPVPENHHHYNNDTGRQRDNENYSGTSTMMVVEREHMFDKVVTPSDVGKLNRLVIPKQHAEKYFPLDSTSNDNKQGLLLNFEDANGKSWRFRYSYWNSSQSYVMTKGWSRFVKDKKLDAGDIVSFHRGLGHEAKDRLFIHWRRRPPPPPPDHMSFSTHHNFSLVHAPQYPHHYFPAGSSRSSPVGWSSVPSGTGLFLPAHALGSRGDHYYTTTGKNNVVYGYARTNNASNSSSHDDLLNNNPRGNSVIYLRSAGGATAVSPLYRHQQQTSLEAEMMRFSSRSSSGDILAGVDQVFESVPVVQGKAAAKRLRLFGVNMDCPISHDDEDDDEEEDHDVTILPSTTTTMVLLPH